MKRQILKKYWLVGVIFLFFLSLFAKANTANVEEYSPDPVFALNSSYEKILSHSQEDPGTQSPNLLLIEFDDQDDICFVIHGRSYAVKIIYLLRIPSSTDFNGFLPVVCTPPRRHLSA